MSAFREPHVVVARRTLLTIMGILGLLLAGIAWLATAYGIGAMDQTKEGYRSVLSQLAGAVVGDGIAYHLAMASLLCVLALSANTSFVDFPRMCRMVAQDGFLPKSFAIAGRRLVFSVGILFLATSCALLLIVFEGITDRLIPLFAVGAFLTFTLSQAGMVVHWRRALRNREAGPRGHRAHLLINGFGAIVTAIALIVIILAKFTEGAWITILVIPAVILLLRRIHAYYEALSASMNNAAALVLPPNPPPLILVAVQGWNALTRKALDLALSLSPDVIAVHLSHLAGAEAEDHAKELRRLWGLNAEEPARAAGLAPPRLIVLQAQYRVIHEPVLKLAAELGAKQKERRIAILVPEVVKQHWYQNLLHAHRANHLRNALMRHGGSRLTVMSMPWYLDAQPQSPDGARRHAPHTDGLDEEPRPERKVRSSVQASVKQGHRAPNQ
jgi:Amino acid permease